MTKTITTNGHTFEMTTTIPAELVQSHAVATAHGVERVDMVRAQDGRGYAYFVALYRGGQHVTWNGPHSKGDAGLVFEGLREIAEAPCDCTGCAV